MVRKSLQSCLILAHHILPQWQKFLKSVAWIEFRIHSEEIHPHKVQCDTPNLTKDILQNGTINFPSLFWLLSMLQIVCMNIFTRLRHSFWSVLDACHTCQNTVVGHSKHVAQSFFYFNILIVCHSMHSSICQSFRGSIIWRFFTYDSLQGMLVTLMAARQSEAEQVCICMRFCTLECLCNHGWLNAIESKFLIFKAGHALFPWYNELGIEQVIFWMYRGC